MDALADYGSSSEDEQDETTAKRSETNGFTNGDRDEISPSPNTGTAKIPEDDVLEDMVKPKAWEKTEAPVKSKRSAVKIFLPELTADSDSDEDGNLEKKPRLAPKSSTLLSFLPAPVGTVSKKTSTTAFLPSSLTSASKAPRGSGVVRKPISRKTPAQAHTAETANLSDDDDSGDFFSLSSGTEDLEKKPVVGPSKQITDTFEPLPEPEPLPSTSKLLPETIPEDKLATLPEGFVKQIQSNEQALAEFEAQGAQLIDVNADSALGGGDVKARLLNTITSESLVNELRAKAKTGIQATQRQRQRHQLHWLAQHAQEREADLQLQWQQGTGGATSGTREKARSKYGFS